MRRDLSQFCMAVGVREYIYVCVQYNHPDMQAIICLTFAAPIPTTAGPTPLDEVVASAHHRYPTLTPMVFSDSSAQWGIFEGQPTSECSPVDSKTPVRTPRMVIHATHSEPSVVTFKFEVHFVTLSSGLTSDPEFVSLLETLLPESKYRVCPGLPEDVISQLDWECSTARRWGFPFHRVDHQDCKLWFPLEKESPRARLKRMTTCKCCTQLLYYVRKKSKERHSTSEATMARRTDPSSNYPLKFLSPASRKKRESQKRKRKLQMDKQLQKLRYQQNIVNVNDATNGELFSIVHDKKNDEI